MKHLLYIFFFFAKAVSSLAQEPYAIHYSKSNGLPSNSVYCVFQDSKGFIWFASNEGLTRYDGYEYKAYVSPELTSTPGSSIVEDCFGRIWYSNFDGYIYYVMNDSLFALNQNAPIQYLPITITKQYLFMFQKKGIDVYDLKTLNYKITKSIPFKYIEFTCASETNFYCITDNTLYRVDNNLNVSSTSYLENINIDIKQIYYYDNKIYVVSKCNESKLIYVFDEKLNHKYDLKIDKPEFIQGLNFFDNLICINTPKGSILYNENENKFIKTIFKDKNISSVLKDRQNNYWFSTTNEGVYLSPDLNNLIYSSFDILPNKIVSVKNDYVIASKKGEVCLYDSLFKFNKNLNKKTDNSDVYYLKYDSISNDLFYSSKGFTHVPQLNDKLSIFYEPAIKEIVRIDDVYYAFSASGYCGLAKFNNTQKKSLWDQSYLSFKKSRVPNTSSIIDAVRGKSVTFNENNNKIYFATNIGLYKATPYLTQEIKRNNQSFYASKIITYCNLLYALDTKGNLYSIKNEREFTLVNNYFSDIKFIKQYGKTAVIIANGFAHLFNLETEVSTKIDVNINAYEINDVLLENKNLFLVTNTGIIKIATDNPTQKKAGAILQLTKFLANGKLFDVEKDNVLPYEQNSISIHYSVLDFGSSKVNNVFFRLNEGNWQQVSNESRLVEFASLKPGRYVVEFKINNTANISKVKFTIVTPFWQTFWFLSICFLGLVFTSVVYYKWQLNKLRTKNKLLQDKNNLLQEKIELEHHLNKSVLKSIKAQMNPHFFYNALNTIQAYIFINDRAKANSYLAKFSKLTRVILEQSEKELITLSNEVESLTLYLELEKMRFKEGFEYSIEQILISNKDNIEFPPMIIQPYVENAIKHGLLHKDTDRELKILFEEKDNCLLVTIDDNGIGRKRSEELNKIKSEKYKSFSSNANEKRLEILNGANDKIAVKIIDKTNSNGQASGTKVILTIPII